MPKDIFDEGRHWNRLPWIWGSLLRGRQPCSPSLHTTLYVPRDLKLNQLQQIQCLQNCGCGAFTSPDSPLSPWAQPVEHWPFLWGLCSPFERILFLLVSPGHLSPFALSNALLFSPVRQKKKKSTGLKTHQHVSLSILQKKKKYETINLNNSP